MNQGIYTDTVPDHGWSPYTCRASRGLVVMVRKAKGGEQIGVAAEHFWARAGDNLCVNPSNGHRWTMDDDTLNEFYIRTEGD